MDENECDFGFDLKEACLSNFIFGIPLQLLEAFKRFGNVNVWIVLCWIHGYVSKNVGYMDTFKDPLQRNREFPIEAEPQKIFDKFLDVNTIIIPNR